MNEETIKLGGKEIIVRPFNIKSLRQMLPRLKSLWASGGGGLPDERLDELLSIVEVALSKANPWVSKDWLEEELSLKDLNGVFDAILRASGLQPAAPGEAAGSTSST